MFVRLVKNMLLFSSSFLISYSSAYASADAWDPALYRESSQMQQRWAMALLDSVDLDFASTILDVGSGDGNITSNIASKYPKAKVVGLDISQRMVQFANETMSKQKNLIFIYGDAHKLPFSNQFDAVSSFSTMHRLQDPQAAITGIYKALKPGGCFVAAFPVKGSPIMTEAIAAVDSRPKWKDYFTAPDRKAYALSDALYRQWLTEANFTVIKARTKWEDERFESRDKFRDLLRATFNHRAFLPEEKETEFFDEIVDEYLKKSPLDEKGRVHFYFNRVEIIAIKPGEAKL